MLKSKPSRQFWSFSYVAPVVAAVIAAIYFYRDSFGTFRANKPELWGQFGDYFGGVLNPIIGLVTVILVVQTLRVTRAEAEETRLELKLQTKNLQDQLNLAQNGAVLAESRQRLDGVLTDFRNYCSRSLQTVPIKVGPHGVEENSSNRTDIWAFLTNPRTLDFAKNLLGNTHNHTNAIAEWRAAFLVEANLLIELGQYCQEHDHLAGNSVLADYYRRRVLFPSLALSTLNLLPAQTVTQLNSEAIFAQHIAGP